MRFAVLGEHRSFFQKKGFIEFENLLSSDEIAEVSAALDQVLCRRLGMPQTKLPSASLEQLLMAGRDVWRDNPVIKRVVSHSRLAEIASELIEKKPLRLAYDQALRAPSSVYRGEITNRALKEWMKGNLSLQDISGFQDVLCGLVLCLSGENNQDAPGQEGEFFPKKAGCGVYFLPNTPIPFAQFFNQASLNCLLIVYTQSKTIYVLRERDPHTHALKRLGYVFGDKLKEDTHPTLYR